MDAQFARALGLEKNGRPAEARDAYRAVPPDSPDRFKALNNLGILLENEERYQEAIDAYRAAIDAESSHPRLYYNLGHALHRQERREAALAAFERSLALDGANASAHYNRAKLLWDLDRTAEAVLGFALAIEVRPDYHKAFAALGDLLFELGRFTEATAALRRATEIEPHNARSFFDLAKCLRVASDYAGAAVALRKSIELDPASCAARELLAATLLCQGLRDEAACVYEDWLREFPNDAVALQLHMALRAPETVSDVSAAFVRDTFDRFASSFDETLERLAYKGPSLLQDWLARQRGPAAGDLAVLDGGCGTGLCAPVLRPYAGRLTGVDLSSGMLRIAENCVLYDELIEGELMATLSERPASYDLIVALDTINYFGDLTGVLSSAAAALSPGGMLFFTVETQGEPAPNFRIQECGRFVHSKEYVAATLANAGLSVLEITPAVLRTEGGQPVDTLLVAASRAAA